MTTDITITIDVLKTIVYILFCGVCYGIGYLRGYNKDR